MFPLFGSKRKADKQAARDKTNVNYGVNHAHARLRGELQRLLALNDVLAAPTANVPPKWRTAFRVLFHENLSVGGMLHAEDADQVLVKLGAAGFTLAQSQALMSWRETSPETLVVVLLNVLCGLPDDTVWENAGSI